MSSNRRKDAAVDDAVSAAAVAPSPADITGLSDAAIESFSQDRDELLGRLPPESLLPGSEEAFYARDPFSADYADFLKEKGEMRRAKAVSFDEELRASLLARPQLMEKPEESAHRGAAAVWRSLRGQLHNEGLELLDTSNIEELEMLQRDLKTRKMVLDSVTKGVDGLLKRVEQRIGEVRAESGHKAKV